MQISGIATENPFVGQNNGNAVRTGGGVSEQAAKGGKTTDPVELVSVGSGATVQQAGSAGSAPELPGSNESGAAVEIATPSGNPDAVGVEAGGKGEKIDVTV